MNSFSGEMGNLVPLIGTDGFPTYTKCLWYRIPLFDYRHNIPNLTYTSIINVQYQLDNHFQTDGGSIPPFVRLTPGIHLDPFNFPRAYLYHDCGYQYGGLYIKYMYDDCFKFRLMKKSDVDSLLATLLPLDGATKNDVRVIMFGIWAGSRYVWDDVKKPLEQKKNRIASGVVVHDHEGNPIPEI